MGREGVDLDFGPVEVRLAGALAGSLGEQASTTVQMEFSRQDVEDNPTGQAPPAENLPGELFGETTSGDGAVEGPGGRRG